MSEQNNLTPTGATQNNAPLWTKPGVYVYRITTPDEPNILGTMGEGIQLVYNLFDRSVQQVPTVCGIVGHDHPGFCNWDGLWPYWSRVTYRAGGTWNVLSRFMEKVNTEYNTKLSFHVNLTDVNIGLRDYPETREFFQQLVKTQSIYRRDMNKTNRLRDVEPPYVPQNIEECIEKDSRSPHPEPVDIIALVDYKKFWDSGLAKKMIDEFYSHLPYPPPILYLDVLTTGGANFTTGFPDGPLGGSEQSQIDGMHDIAKYLDEKGTAVGTEGYRGREVGKYGSYSWLHGDLGYSTDDYSVILGAAKGPRAVLQHVMGNTGCFVVSVIAQSPRHLEKVKDHYKDLLTGKPLRRKMPGLDTWHISDRGEDNDEFNMWIAAAGEPSGGGDPFRGDWIDLVNNFYLSGIQELYHLGKGNYRTAKSESFDAISISRFEVVAPSGEKTDFPILQCLPVTTAPWTLGIVRTEGHARLEGKLSFKIDAPKTGLYQIKLYGGNSGQREGTLHLYVNGKLTLTKSGITLANKGDFSQELDLGSFDLTEGSNEILLDSGRICAEWNDGTKATWETPALGIGFKVTNGDVTFALDYDRMWPDTWSGQKKIYFFSWDGTDRTWKLPVEWRDRKQVTLYPLTPDGRGKGISLQVEKGSIAPKLLPLVPYILTE